MKNGVFAHRKGFRLPGSTLLLLLIFATITSAIAQEVEWKKVIFGQSVSPGGNTITIDESTKAVTLSAGTSDGKSIGGKVASGHDGISYYYVELDSTKNFEISAQVQVNYFAKERPDNQESFGIMARDVIGKDLSDAVLPSHMVLVGGYRGEIQSMYRDSIQDSTGKGAKRLGVNYFAARPTNDGNSVYTLTMKKTNTGFHVSVNGMKEMVYYRPKLLEKLNSSKIYVGFFAARVASITVSDIKFSTSDVATDPPGKPEPVEVFLPKDSVTTPLYWSLPKYELKMVTNSGGDFKINLNGKDTTAKIAQPGEFKRMFDLVKDTNVFDIQFVAKDAPLVTAMSQHIVVYRTFGDENGMIYASPTGTDSATGTKDDPIDVYSALYFLRPGQTAVLLEGTYTMFRPLLIERGNDGTAEKVKTVQGNGKAILDFKGVATGVALWADYWKFVGVDVTQSRDCGIRVYGNHNVMELVNTYKNGNTGLQVSGISTEKRDMWPTHNLILNCESYDNRDPSENNADGFAAKLTCGANNVFRGCIARNNCDDGWDLYAKLETGVIGEVVIENCIAYGNGSLSDGYKTKGDGNGFKLGGEGLAIKHVLRNSIAFNNNAAGITNNSNPAIIVENTTSFDNLGANYSFAVYAKSKAQFTATNNISFRTKSGPGDKDIEPVKGPTNYFYTSDVSSNDKGKKITEKNFESLEFQPFKRLPDGSFDQASFLKVKSDKLGGAIINDYSNSTPVIPPKKAVDEKAAAEKK